MGDQGPEGPMGDPGVNGTIGPRGEPGIDASSISNITGVRLFDKCNISSGNCLMSSPSRTDLNCITQALPAPVSYYTTLLANMLMVKVAI